VAETVLEVVAPMAQEVLEAQQVQRVVQVVEVEVELVASFSEALPYFLLLEVEVAEVEVNLPLATTMAVVVE